MTVYEDIEIEYLDYKLNDIKKAVANNSPIEEKLNIIVVISNPCLYKRRYVLFHEFIERLEEEENVRIFVVELAYGEQSFAVTDALNPQHLQLRTHTSPIWHKENMINLAVTKLLPKDWRAFAWIDADIEFESTTWALDTLKILNGSRDVVQLFSHCVDMDKSGKRTLNIFHSFGYSFCRQKPYKKIGGQDYWHPGYAWAMTRRAYEKLGGLYDVAILGSADNIMSLCFIGKCEYMTNEKYSAEYNKSMFDYQKRAKSLRLGYVPGVICHHYHGSKKNRRYTERWQILIKHQFSPNAHLLREDGLIIPSIEFSDKFARDIVNYFEERREDD